MSATTVAELIDRAKAAADMHDDFVTQAQWIYWVNQEHRALQVSLARQGHVLYEASESIATTGTYNPYPIQQPVAVVSAYEVVAGRYRRIRVRALTDGRQDMTTSGHATQVSFSRNDAAGGQLNVHLWPNPPAGQTYLIFIVPQPATLVYSGPTTGEADSVYYPMGWEERIVLGLARRAVAKEEGSTRELKEQIAEIDQTISDAVWSQILTSSPVVRNVDDVERGWSAGISPTPVGSWTFF